MTSDVIQTDVIQTVVRPAQEADWPAIAALLGELELDHPLLRCEQFYVAAAGERIAGVAHLEACDGAVAYMSSVGVRRSDQRQGIARALLGDILARARCDVYLYTRIPDFFRRFGFVPTDPPPVIPSREIYDCEACGGRAGCCCMVRRASVSSVE